TTTTWIAATYHSRLPGAEILALPRQANHEEQLNEELQVDQQVVLATIPHLPIARSRHPADLPYPACCQTSHHLQASHHCDGLSLEVGCCNYRNSTSDFEDHNGGRTRTPRIGASIANMRSSRRDIGIPWCAGRAVPAWR